MVKEIRFASLGCKNMIEIDTGNEELPYTFSLLFEEKMQINLRVLAITGCGALNKTLEH